MALVTLCLCAAFVAWLFYVDTKRRRPVSPALWLAVAWVVLRGSRPAATWFGFGYIVETPEDYLQGNPLDRIINLSLIVAACFVLLRRHTNWSGVAAHNKALLLFYFYMGLTVLWAGDSFVAFKRWFKDAGNVLMVLIILTDRQPREAIKTVFARATYLLLPFSAVLVRFSGLGRNYSRAGEPMYIGVATHKNSLGVVVVTCGLILLWDLLTRPQTGRRREDRVTLYVQYGLLTMGAWLLYMANSVTSLICGCLGTAILLAGRLPAVKRLPRRIVAYSVAAALTFLVLERSVGIVAPLARFLGRDPHWGRFDVWQAVRSVNVNPLIGTGYLSFWSEESRRTLWEDFAPTISAHNGYMEIYLDGGFVAVALLMAMLLAAGRKIMRGISVDPAYGNLRFAVLVMAIVHNMAESSFARLGLIWFTLLLVAIEYPKPTLAAEETPGPACGPMGELPGTAT